MQRQRAGRWQVGRGRQQRQAMQAACACHACGHVGGRKAVRVGWGGQMCVVRKREEGKGRGIRR